MCCGGRAFASTCAAKSGPLLETDGPQKAVMTCRLIHSQGCDTVFAFWEAAPVRGAVNCGRRRIRDANRSHFERVPSRRSLSRSQQPPNVCDEALFLRARATSRKGRVRPPSGPFVPRQRNQLLVKTSPGSRRPPSSSRRPRRSPFSCWWGRKPGPRTS